MVKPPSIDIDHWLLHNAPTGNASRARRQLVTGDSIRRNACKSLRYCGSCQAQPHLEDGTAYRPIRPTTNFCYTRAEKQATVAKPLLQVGRNLSDHRIGAYQCTVDGSVVSKGKWVVGWYGMFSEERLRAELIPKLSEYVQQAIATYPILLTTYMLESKSDVWIAGHPKGARAGDVKFRPRQQRTSQQDEVIVHSATKYQSLQ